MRITVKPGPDLDLRDGWSHVAAVAAMGEPAVRFETLIYYTTEHDSGPHPSLKDSAVYPMSRVGVTDA